MSRYVTWHHAFNIGPVLYMCLWQSACAQLCNAQVFAIDNGEPPLKCFSKPTIMKQWARWEFLSGIHSAREAGSHWKTAPRNTQMPLKIMLAGPTGFQKWVVSLWLDPKFWKTKCPCLRERSLNIGLLHTQSIPNKRSLVGSGTLSGRETFLTA